MAISRTRWLSLILLVVSVERSQTSASIGSTLLLPLSDVRDLSVLVRENSVAEDTRNLYVEWFMRSAQHPYQLGSYDARRLAEMDMSWGSYVIVTTLEDLAEFVRHHTNGFGTFFYALTNSSDPSGDDATSTLRSIWTEYSVYRMYLLADDGVYIYDPFDFDHEAGLYGRMRPYSGEQTLERLLFTNMRGYPLRVQLFKSVYSQPVVDKVTKKLLHIEGVDWKVTQLLQERLNFTMILQEPSPDYFGERDAQGNYNGAIGMLIRNEFDLCLTGFFIKDYMVPQMDFTVAVYDDMLCIYVPKAKRVPQSILPILSVRGDLWGGFICTAFVCILIWWLLRQLNLRLGVQPLSGASKSTARLRQSPRLQFMRIFIDTWVVWVRSNIIRYPPFYSERIFIVSLCLVSVIFGAIFESSLATVYIHPMYYKDIMTMQELDDSGLRVIYKYSSMGDDLFFSDTSPLFASLNKKLYHLKDLNADVILDVAQNGGKSGVTRYTSLMSESLHFILSKRVWVVPECPKHYTISYILARNAPWEEAVNDLLLRFLNAGLINKYITEMQTEVDIRIMKQQLIETSDTFKVLTIADLQLAFYVVMLGNAWAAVLFIGGRLYTRRKPH